MRRCHSRSCFSFCHITALLLVITPHAEAQSIACHRHAVELCQRCNQRWARCIDPAASSNGGLKRAGCPRSAQEPPGAALAACSPCRPYADCARMSRMGEEYRALPLATACTFGSARERLDKATKWHMKHDNHKAWLPALNAARKISATSFKTAGPVNVGPDVVQQYKIIDAGSLLSPLSALYRTRERIEAARLSDALVEQVLPHIHVDGRALTLDDIAVYGFQLDRGAYFPDMHWDMDWAMFPNAAGFQVMIERVLYSYS